MDELLKWWFESENTPDLDVLAYVDKLRAEGMKCYLVSDNEKYRAEFIKHTMKLADHFDECFFSSDLGYKKSDPEFFKIVLEKIHLKPEEVVYWDDDEKDLQWAEKLGIDGRLFTDLNGVKLN